MYKLVRLTIDNLEPYNMVNTILANENEFKNTAFGLSLIQFKDWLVEQNNWADGVNLPDGYVPQIIYWFYVNKTPVGIGKIRLKLTKASLDNGGNIGYAIGKQFRGKGYGTFFLRLLIDEAKKMGVEDILLTVEKYNPSSKRVIEKVGGRIIKETEQRWYFSF